MGVSGGFGGGRPTGGESRSYGGDRSSRGGDGDSYGGNDYRDFNREGRNRRFGSGGGGGRRGGRGTCYDYLDGRCNRGNSCRFSHEEGGGSRRRNGGGGGRDGGRNRDGRGSKQERGNDKFGYGNGGSSRTKNGFWEDGVFYEGSPSDDSASRSRSRNRSHSRNRSKSASRSRNRRALPKGFSRSASRDKDVGQKSQTSEKPASATNGAMNASAGGIQAAMARIAALNKLHKGRAIQG